MKANPDTFQAICVGKKAPGNIGSPEYISDLIKIKTSIYDFRGERKGIVPRVKEKSKF